MPHLRSLLIGMSLSLVLVSPLTASNGTLQGSRASMLRQNEVARSEDFTFLRTPDQVRRFVDEGYLVPLEGGAGYRMASGVSHPVARPELRTFIERLGAQYVEACGERLVVTSLTRPISAQPGNAHPLSVHPAGMAVDLRISRRTECRRWLEGALLKLEGQGLLDVTRESRPPHYHVAVFPEAYGAYVERMMADSVATARAAAPAQPSALTRRAAPPAMASSLLPAAPAEERRDGGLRGPLSVAAVYLLLALRWLWRRVGQRERLA